VDDPFALLGKHPQRRQCFLGRNAPEALGDYFAGPNHTLPTAGTARFSSPLGVDDFVKRSSFLYYPPQALAPGGARIAAFAERGGAGGPRPLRDHPLRRKRSKKGRPMT
jgi:histidinol dehydrogenase